MHKAFPLPVIEFPLLEAVPTASEESCHCQKKREGTVVKIALLLKSRRNCQSKSDDSYANAVSTATTDTTSDGTSKKKGRTIIVTTEDMKKRKNDVKARTTLLLSLPDEHQLRFSKYKTAQELWAAILKTFGGNEATKKTKKNLLKQQYGNFKAEGSETLEQTFNRLSDLDSMSLDDLYNHLKVYESEVQKKSEPNPQNMAFISSAKHSRGNEDGNTSSVSLLALMAPRSQDRGRRDNYRQGSKVEEQAPKSLMAINGVGWDWSYMANDEENHALVADKEAPTEFALMANISVKSKVFDNSLYSKDCKKNTDSLNSKITDLTDKLFDAKNMIYHYKLRLTQVESRLVEHKDREIKYCEKIRGLELEVEFKTISLECLAKELKSLKKETEGLDGKLAGFQTASKDLDSLLESQRLDKNKEGLGYNAVPPPAAQIYSSSKKDMSWTGLPEFKDDTVTDSSRPAPTVESSPDDTQNRNPSVTEEASPSTISPKSFIKFEKANDSPTNSKTDKAETAKKPHVKYAEQYRKPTKKPNVRGNQQNWNNLKSHQLGCKITGKGTIKTGKLEFENVYFVKDLKYNLVSVSQICDNKNSVLFTDSECIVLGRNFKLSDDDNVLLRTPREHNMYSIDLNNIVTHKDLTCLVAKAFADECMLWYRRLGHLNFKTMNILVRHNLVRGLPTKCFKNDHTCTACLKGKQHKASLTDDFSKFTWTFFLKTKDETSGILRKFITEIENLKDLKVKIIRTPQQNGVAERRNRTLIEADRTMLADAKLPVTFWAEVVNTACFVQNRVLVNKSQNKTPWVRPIGTKYVLKNKKDERGIVIRNKAMLVAQGYTQKEGIVYDEVFAHVARIKAIRLFLAYASFMGFTVYQMDVKSAFLYSTIDKEVSSNTSMDKENPWGKDETRKDVDLHLYRSMIGSLIYLTTSRPDIMFAVLYTDSDYGGATQDRKSTTGGCQFLGRRDCFEKKLISVDHIHTDENVADLLTKPFDAGRFQYLVSEHNVDFHPIVDFVEASPLRYALTVKPTIYVSHIRQFWSTARIETTEEGTKILVTVDGILRTVTESSLRRNLKLQDEEGIRFNELSSNIATALVCLATNRTYKFSKMIFDGMVKNVNNKFSKFLMYSRFLAGEGSGTPTEPHHIPSPEAQHTSYTTHSSPTLPPITTALIPTVTPFDTPTLRQYTRRASIAQSLALPPVANKPASPLRDVIEGKACPTDSGFGADQDRANIAKTSTLPHDLAPRELEINMLKARVKLLEDREGVTAERSRNDALIKGRNLDEGEAAAERVSDDTEEMATVMTSMDATTILASGVAEVPTGSGSIPIVGPPAAEVPTGSDVVPTAGLIFATAIVIARDAEIARIHAEEELQIMIDGLDRSNETVAKYLQEYHQFATELSLERRIELIIIKSNLGWKVKDFRGMTFEEIEAKFTTVWKQLKDFIPMGSKEEDERLKRKGLGLEQESVKKLKTSEIVPEEVKSPDEVPEEKVKEMMQLVPIEEVELKRLYEPDDEDQLWTHTQNLIHALVEWKLYDTCGVHHVTAKDKEIFMLVEKDYPLWKGLAIGMISYKLQGRIVGNKMHKVFPLLVIDFPLPDAVPNASEESCHCQKKRQATAVKIALLLKSKRNCQSKSDDSYAKLVPHVTPCILGITIIVTSVILVSENVEALKNVIEDEPHFFMKIIHNDLRALTMITKHFMSKQGKQILAPKGRSYCGKGGRCGSIARRCDEKISSTGSKIMANKEHCLDGCDGAGGGEIKGGRVNIGVVNSLLGEILGDVIGETSRDIIRVDEGAVW
nr:hypothetical protein [Tanacetum cinerariifolium]